MLNKRLFDWLFREAAFIVLAAVSAAIANQAVSRLLAIEPDQASQMNFIALSTAIALLFINFTDYFSTLSRLIGRLNIMAITACITAAGLFTAILLMADFKYFIYVSALSGSIAGLLITARQAIKNLLFKENIKIVLDLQPQERSPVIEELAAHGLLERSKVMLLEDSEDFTEKRFSKGVILISDKSCSEPSDSLLKALQSGIPLMDYRDFCSQLSGRIRMDQAGMANYILISTAKLSGMYADAKKIAEPLIALILLMLLSPVMLIVIAAIKFSSRGPAIISYNMIGLNQKQFKILKFRTSLDEKKYRKLSDHYNPEMTRTGSFLRKTGIEKLPMLWNIIRSEMSFIGPQPEHPLISLRLSEKLPCFSLQTLVKPGIVSWMNSEKRLIGESKSRLEYDLYYIKNLSPALDAQILVDSLLSVFRLKSSGSSTCIVELQSDWSGRSISMINSLGIR